MTGSTCIARRSNDRASGAGCGRPLAAARSIADDRRVTNGLENLTIDAFQPRVGHTFRIRQPDGEIEAELIEARALGGGPGRAGAGTRRRVPFSLSFRTSATAPLPQRIYEVAHDEMGSYEIFLVPIGPDGRGMVYEAIFT